tara:strand:+ start:1673 stop:2485 length:813 start_codon:yes stop_codon:yes gene_type:complete
MDRSLLVPPETLSRNPAGVVVVDPRPPEAFAAGHIPGARSLPVGELFDPETEWSRMRPAEEIHARLAEAGLSASVPIVIADDAGLIPSAKTFWVLESVGVANVRLLDGGIPAWVALGLPLETGPQTTPEPPPVRPGDAIAGTPGDGAPDRSPVANHGDVMEALDRRDVVLIDARSPEEYREGHIPGAINLNWEEHLVEPDHSTLRPLDALRMRYRDAQVPPDSRVITYCRSATRSAHTYFVLRALGYRNVSNYAGSWLEWSEKRDSPVER